MWHRDTGVLPAADIISRFNLSPISLTAKEGLALINGTQFITSIASLAAFRARQLALQADIVGALTLDVMMGTPIAFDEAVHRARPHEGQGEVRARQWRAAISLIRFGSLFQCTGGGTIARAVAPPRKPV